MIVNSSSGIQVVYQACLVGIFESLVMQKCHRKLHYGVISLYRMVAGAGNVFNYTYRLHKLLTFYK